MARVIITSFQLIGSSANRYACLIFALIFVNSLLEAMSLGLVFGIGNLIANPDKLSEFGVLQTLYERSGLDDVSSFLILIILLLMLAFAFKAAFFLLLTWLKYDFATSTEAMSAAELYRLYLKSPVTELTERNSSELITNIANRMFAMVHTAVLGSITIATDLLMVLGIFAVLFYLSPEISILIVAFFGVATFVAITCLRPLLRRYGARDAVLSEAYLQVLQEGFENSKFIKLMGREWFFSHRYLGVRMDQARLRRKMFTLQETPRQAIELFVLLALLGFLLFVAVYGTNADKMVGLFVLFGAAMFRVMPAANRMLFTINHIQSHVLNIQKVSRDVIRLRRVTNPLEYQNTRSAARGFEFTQSIKFERLTFSYPGAEESVLQDIDCEIYHGEKVGLVGKTGSGKSTFVDLAMALLQPAAGHIKVDGRNLSDFGVSWREKIGFVPQSVMLLDDSIRRNIAFATPEDEIDEERVKQSLSHARLKEFVLSQPAGLDTRVGEAGTRLSGGQIQRIGIARALYRDPEFVVMDEATSALDPNTEREIAHAVNEMKGKKTFLIIAHRLSTIQDCDRVLFLSGGKLVGNDAYDVLYRDNQEFRRFVKDDRL